MDVRTEIQPTTSAHRYIDAMRTQNTIIPTYTMSHQGFQRCNGAVFRIDGSQTLQQRRVHIFNQLLVH